MYPLKMKPVLKDYIWGGTRLISDYGKKTNLTSVAESWEISCHPDGLSVVENGCLSGQTLCRVLELHPEWLGERCDKSACFPLLIKLIDAREPLSLQVHPDDEYARRTERQSGKNEMWYVIDAEPGAEVILGFKEGVRKSDVENIILRGELLSAVRRIPARAGDSYRVPAGMLHSIGAGVLIAEIQQASNVTYRVYDYGRKNQNGCPRELHTDKALDVLDVDLRAERAEGNILADWPFFRSKLINVDNVADYYLGRESFCCFVVISGDLLIEWAGGGLLLRKGETAFIPAGFGSHRMSGPAEVISVSMG